MQRKSWILLLISFVLCSSLGFAFFLSRSSPEVLTKESANSMIEEMKKAVSHKSVGGIMAYIAPDPEVEIAKMHPDNLALLISRAFHVSGKLIADCNNLTFVGSGESPTTEFDLVVHHQEQSMTAEDYRGHIKLRWRRVNVPHIFGLYHTKEWRIFSAETDGKDPSTFGDT